MTVAAALLRRAVGVSDEQREVVWSRGGSQLRARIPGDDLWVVVKDDLLLREYEWLGVDLDAASGVVIDAGANVGTFTLEVARRARRVIAVEPNPATADLLEANLAANGHADVEVIRAALWSGDDGAELDISRTPSSASIVAERATGARIACPTVTLAALLGEHADVDLLKIDIEGAEYEVLGSATTADLRRIRCIVGELHPFGGDPEHLAEHLRAAGFAVDLRQGPFFHPFSAMAALVTGARSVRGLHRLKIVVGATLLASAALTPAPSLRRRLAGPELLYLVATRRSDSVSGRSWQPGHQ